MRALLLLALLGLAACDSTAPPPEPLRSFDVTSVPSLPSIEMRDTVRVAAPQFAGPTAPTLTVDASPGLATTLEGDSLSLHALALGDATVSIHASAAGYRDTTVVLEVSVVPGVCPPGPGAGQHDLFPFEDGQQWVFDVEQASGSLGNLVWAPYGTLRVAFQDVHCLRGVRRGSLRYTKGASNRVAEINETSTNEVRFTIPADFFDRSALTVVLDRYHDSPAASVPVSASRLEFEAGVGLRYASYLGYGGGAAGYSGRRLIRQL